MLMVGRLLKSRPMNTIILDYSTRDRHTLSPYGCVADQNMVMQYRLIFVSSTPGDVPGPSLLGRREIPSGNPTVSR